MKTQRFTKDSRLAKLSLDRDVTVMEWIPAAILMKNLHKGPDIGSVMVGSALSAEDMHKHLPP